MPSGSAPTPGPLTREVGAILRARVARLNLTLSDLTEASGVSVPQLSRMFRGLARIDLEQFTAICERLGLRTEDVWAEAKGESPEATPLNLPPDELIRRLQYVIGQVNQSDVRDTWRKVAEAASLAGQNFSPSDLKAFLDGRGQRPNATTITTIASALDVDEAYFRSKDPEVIRQVEVSLRFKRVARDSGLLHMAARGELSTEALEAIADLIESKHLTAREH